MRARFLGGAGEVGNVGMVLEAPDGGKTSRYLFDYGFSAEKPPRFLEAAPRVEALFLTHSHLDHCGLVPAVAGRQHVPVVSNAVTREVANLLALDSIKIAEQEGYDLPYGNGEAKAALREYAPGRWGEAIDTGPLTVTPHPAGHIPGATMYEVEDGDGRRILFTGDIHTLTTRLTAGTSPVECHTLIVEGTYGGREHPERKAVEREFMDKIDEVVDRGGLAVVPAFAVSRTQEMMLLLAESGLDVWVDGMGRKVTGIYLDNPRYLASARNLRRAEERLNIVRSSFDRARALKGDVIITTGGMLEGGPALHYIGHIRDSDICAILLTGYQVEGCNGRLLVEKKMLRFSGVEESIGCEVCTFDFSAHAGHSELLGFIRGCRPERVVLFHSETREAIARELDCEVLMPKNGEVVEL